MLSLAALIPAVVPAVEMLHLSAFTSTAFVFAFLTLTDLIDIHRVFPLMRAVSVSAGSILERTLRAQELDHLVFHDCEGGHTAAVQVEVLLDLAWRVMHKLSLIHI